jgi:hypothetical protein
MSNTDNLAEQKPTEQEERQSPPLLAKPLHRQLSTKLFALLLTIIIALAFTFTLFYQQSERNQFRVDSELMPLKQKFQQLQALQKAELLVNRLLFTDSAENYVELQTELIAVNRKLLRLGSSNAHLYQQWLNGNKAASDIVMRIQQSHGRNEQLKQSSIIQLQLMWFSITPIINKESAQQELLFKQLTADNVKDKLTFSRASAYVSGIRQLHNLQQLKSLLAEVLISFEQMTLHTSIEDFDLLRLGVEQIFAQGNILKKDNQTKAMVDFIQQIDTFKEIVLTDQRALAKWQGYIRLAQSYQLDLTMQKNQLTQILSEPQAEVTINASNLFDDWLDKLNLNLSQRELSLIILLAIGLSLLVFCYLLWRLREQIKITAQQSVVLVHKRIHAENSDDIQANCAETQEIMQKIQYLVKPAHNEKEFQQLLQQYQEQQQVIDEQAQALIVNTENSNQQQLDVSDQVSHHLQNELQRYKYLEDEVLSFFQRQQASLFNQLVNKPVNNQISATAQLPTLLPVYEQLKQFSLTNSIRLKNTVLTLSDVSLVDEIHAVLMNKQAEHQVHNNQLYFSCDQQILVKVKIDFRLFEQLINLLIDIALVDCKNTRLHLHLRLKDKSVGQQLVHFVVKVHTKAIEVLPSLLTQLLDSQTTVSQKSPMVDMFNTLFVRQHGESITAQLIDDGFQLGFELPLAIASSSVIKEQQETTLEGIRAILLSNNAMLAGLVKKSIQSALGQVEVITCIEAFKQQVNEEYLSKHKTDIFIFASDIVQTDVDLISEQLNCLPNSVQPKLMQLQSNELNFDCLGFYSQTEQLLFKDAFLHKIKMLLTGEASNNQLISPEQCLQSYSLLCELPVLLAVNSPQKYQNIQRLLRWMGLQVHVVSHADAQREQWKTGLYCILFTEFTETSLLKMTSKPLVDIGIFSLTDVMPNPANSAYFDDWHIGQLTEQSTLAELAAAIAPWLQYVKPPSRDECQSLALSDEFIESVNEDIDECVITELVASLAEENNDSAFDFSQYLHHQGSVELALFMLDDYAHDNHQQLDNLIIAIKGKDFDKAKEATSNLQVNANILAAEELKQLCTQWSKLLNGNEIPSSLKEVNVLLKETRTALVDIDSYAESI